MTTWSVSRRPWPSARSGWPVAVCTAFLLLAHTAAAQVVRGRVLAPDSTPVAGSILFLVDSAGATAARTLSDAHGEFLMRAPVPGVYRLRSLRIGFRPFTSAAFPLVSDSMTTQTVVVSSIPVTLSKVQITGKNECRTDPAEGSAALELWTEARKALLTSVLSREARALEVRLLTYERTVDPTAGGERVVSQQLQIRSGPSRKPFYSTPAADLDQRGYAIPDADGTIYLAPDADVLLSELFGAGHCLRAVMSPDSGRIGLAFSPARRRENVVDVEGTLWLDRITAELQTMDFQYTNVPGEFMESGGGGHLAFARLPGGAWIVSRWELRLPLLARVRSNDAQMVVGASGRPGFETRTSSRLRVRGIQLTGGAVLEAKEEGRIVWSAGLPSLHGTVTEAPNARSVPAVALWLIGTDYRATTDAEGVFSFAEVLPGRYTLRVRAPVLDSMGYRPTDIDVEVNELTPLSQRITLLSPANALKQLCHIDEQRPLEPVALLRGIVRDDKGAAVGAGHRVVALWFADLDSRFTNVDVKYARRAAETDSAGEFTFCRVPTGKRITLTAWWRSGAPTDSVSFVIGPDETYRYISLRPAR